MSIYPLVVYLHISNPVTSPHSDITADYLGGGVGIELKNGISIEGSLGLKDLGCRSARCGVEMGGSLTVTWRGKKRNM
jgi:hypothetical protein